MQSPTRLAKAVSFTRSSSKVQPEKRTGTTADGHVELSSGVDKANAATTVHSRLEEGSSVGICKGLVTGQSFIVKGSIKRTNRTLRMQNFAFGFDSGCFPKLYCNPEEFSDTAYNVFQMMRQGVTTLNRLATRVIC